MEYTGLTEEELKEMYEDFNRLYLEVKESYEEWKKETNNFLDFKIE